ncbi:MAG: acyl-CoA dehydrogenase family protein [Candidatus Yanofskybacteria bacterium]|nr:acyl-CoA dehydrogenase family protein [Candidatus Yanofskybacteria bacterium]
MAEVVSGIVGNIGVIKFSNPPFNFLTREMLEGFEKYFKPLYHNESVKAVVVKSEGLAFSAGVDIKLISAMAKSGDRSAVEKLLKALHGNFDLMSGGEKPVIAAVNGFCFGGGLELALACNFIVVPSDSQTISFACPEVDYGIIPGLGATQRLPRRIEPRLALKMLLGGKSAAINAEVAYSIGLVDELVADEDFNKGVIGFVNRVLNSEVKMSADRNDPRPDFKGISREDFNSFAKEQPSFAAYLINSVVNEGLKLPMPEAWSDVELPALLNCLFTSDALEGLSSFLQKRKPSFSMVVGSQESSAQKTETVVQNAEVPPWEKEEYKMLRQTIREFAEQELTWSKVRQMEKTETVTKELLGKMAELGLFGAGFPESVGGFGLGKVGVCVLADELAYYHPATAVVMGASSSLAGEAVYLFGNEDQKQRYLIPVIEGKKIGAFATTEPGIGSDIANISTMAKKVEGGWRLRGSKQFITNGEIADFVIVTAQTDPDGGQKTLSLFIVDTGSKGFAITKREEKMGIHASRTNSFALDDIFVPEADVLADGSDGKKKGFKATMKIFNHSRITVAASCIGMMRRAIDEAWNYAKDRRLFGKMLYEHQNTVREFGEMRAKLLAVENMVLDAAWKLDRGLDVRSEAAAVKYFAAETAFNVIDRAGQLHGGNRFIADFPIEMLQRDIVVFRVFEGTSEVQVLFLGKEFITSRLI